jgi:NADH-quinone oxidoreductase subunit C
MTNEDLLKNLTEKNPQAIKGSTGRFGQLEIQVERPKITDVVKTLRDDPEFGFNMLIDIVSVDYSAYPDWSGDRFGLIYHLKSLGLGHRAWLKITAPEEEPSVPTISHLYGNAEWLEREAFDQMGVRFTGHPNLKRILNHHEFVGHPLRKDYPITRRQWLSANESLMDEMEARLKGKGYA